MAEAAFSYSARQRAVLAFGRELESCPACRARRLPAEAATDVKGMEQHEWRFACEAVVVVWAMESGQIALRRTAPCGWALKEPLARALSAARAAASDEEGFRADHYRD